MTSRSTLFAVALAILAGAPMACDHPRESSPAGLYREYCARCHGAGGDGVGRTVEISAALYPGVDLTASSMVEKQQAELVAERLLDGFGPMPAFRRKLTAQQIEALTQITLTFVEHE